MKDCSTPKILSQVNDFYERAAEEAKQKGLVINIISLVERGCKLEMLSPIADNTGGDIIRLDPNNVGIGISTTVSTRIIATNVELKVIIHKGLQFRNEIKENLSKNKTNLIKKIGNVTEESEVNKIGIIDSKKILDNI